MTQSRGYANRRVAWISMAVGAATGMILGLWSFDGPFGVPAFLGDYDATARRLVRLGHIACFGLAFINLLLARELPALELPPRLRGMASRTMNFGNVALPLTLFVAAVVPPAKYLMPLPAASILIALVLTARGVRHEPA